eukprot:Phypoly_transcript_04034.p1 GENE.Phypoly_transcript_04034~~Phypoly_transcript_04034.p1  ORF type:complete len:453 (+),score=46.54 Phypoly_transcript_04034:902-2260(+)
MDVSKMDVADLYDEIDFYHMNWSVVWWHLLSFYWLFFAVYVLQANKVRHLFVFTSFFVMAGIVSLLSTRVDGDPPAHFHLILFAFSGVLMAIVYFNKVTRGKRFGPLMFKVLLLLQLGVVIENVCKELDSPIKATPFEGEILDVDIRYTKKHHADTPLGGTRKMHITCRGTGKSLVLLDAGIPFWSASLSGAAQQISEKYPNTTVCTYDRLGYGWSEKTRNERNTVNMVNEVRSLLVAAKINNKRMIYVGWSFGGLIAQLYARLFPAEMLGIILVDSMDHNVLTDDPALKDEINTGRIMFTLSKALVPIGFMRLVGFLGLLPPECGFPLSNTHLPHESEDAMRALFYSQPQFLDAAFDELDDLVAALEQSHELLGTPERVPENVPTIVLRSNMTVSPAYNKSHKRLLRLSNRKVELITNKSDHYIPMRDPDSILDALRALFTLRKNMKPNFV